MKCPVCKSDDTLFATVLLRVEAPLLRGGGISLSGITVSQASVKDAWAKNEKRHPVTCVACSSEFHYDTTGKGLTLGPPGPSNQLELFPEPEEDAADDD